MWFADYCSNIVINHLLSIATTLLYWYSIHKQNIGIEISDTESSLLCFQNRKNDEASYEKMLKLRRDLSRAVTILEMIKRREKSKRELLHLTLEIVEKR